LIYDSLQNPSLIIEKYIEYDFSNHLKLAEGKWISIEEPNPPKFGLVDFYRITPNADLEQLIKSSIEEKDYDTSYLEKKHSSFGVIIFKTENKIKRITYYKGNLPSELDSLQESLFSYFENKNLITEEPFKIDSLVTEFQKYIFERNPPPPPPLKGVHFTPPEIKQD